MSAMHAADAARRKDADTGAMRQQRRRRYRRPAVDAAHADQRQVPHAHLERGRVCRQRLYLRVTQSHPHRAAPYPDDGGDSARGPNRLRHPPGDVDVGGIGEAVRDQRGFQRDDRLPGVKRLLNLQCDSEITHHSTLSYFLPSNCIANAV